MAGSTFLFIANISESTQVQFTLRDLVNPNPLFSIRELVIPWLRLGNKPELVDSNFTEEHYDG